jgi:hypothetical protein
LKRAKGREPGDVSSGRQRSSSGDDCRNVHNNCGLLGFPTALLPSSTWPSDRRRCVEDLRITTKNHMACCLGFIHDTDAFSIQASRFVHTIRMNDVGWPPLSFYPPNSIHIAMTSLYSAPVNIGSSITSFHRFHNYLFPQRLHKYHPPSSLSNFPHQP